MTKKIAIIIVTVLLIATFIFNLIGCTKPVDSEPKITIDVVENEDTIIIIDKINDSENTKLTYHLNKGRYSYSSNGADIMLNATAEAKDGEVLYELKNYSADNRSSTINDFGDQIGKGRMLTVRSSAPNQPHIIQQFKIYDNQQYILFSICLESISDALITSNYSAPLVLDNESTVIDENDGIIGGININDDNQSINMLRVPFDNDDYIEYETKTHSNITSMFSSEMTIFYDEGTQDTFLLGSVEHTTYKSGITLNTKDVIAPFCDVKLYSGATDYITRDFHYTLDLQSTFITPHGYITAGSVWSAEMIMGYFDDHASALETYGDINAAKQPPLGWKLGVPMGWMSWSAYGMDLDLNKVIDNSEFMKDELSNFSNNGITYVNTDSYNGRGSGTDLEDIASSIIENGQIPGTYDTPYSYWNAPTEENLDKYHPDTNNKYTIREMVVKTSDGNPVRIGRSASGGRMVFDPTHPGTKMIIEAKYRRIINAGYGYIKMDFISDSAVEGVFDDKSITTGIQAYNYGMNYIKELLSKEKAGRDIFISTSIAPIFPGGYAHSRRISCDAFGSIKESKYMLNSLTYGWWLGGRVYQYNDPDHTSLYKYYGNEDSPDKIYNEAEAETRLNASIIAGSVLLLSDDFQLQGAKDRIKSLVDNRDLINVALIGKSFKPLDFSESTSKVFYMRDNDKLYIAVFNYSSSVSSIVSLDLTKLGLKSTTDKEYNLKSLNDGTIIASTHLFIKLLPRYTSVIYEVSLN
ncbi:MAG: hypothetical protein LBF68_00910 [Christensenellaceae bacterium]|jgi:hypothetical protein|nr:hypothetical protein [Christensenellaceae bacterium]